MKKIDMVITNKGETKAKVAWCQHQLIFFFFNFGPPVKTKKCYIYRVRVDDDYNTNKGETKAKVILGVKNM